MSLNTRQIEVIHAVVHTGSVTDAANFLGVSQPAVSMTLRECNQLVGFPLFERRQGRMQPTHETLIMVPELEKIMSGIHRIDRLVGDLRDSSIGYVRLAVAPLLADSIVPPALAVFRRERVQVSLVSANAEDILTEINEDLVDLGLSLSSSPSASDFVLDLGATKLVCVLHKNHILAGRPFLTPKDIASHPLVGFSKNVPLAGIIGNSFRLDGLACNVICEVSNTSTACALVEQNIGIALVPALGLSRHKPQDIVEREFRPQSVVTVQLLLPRHRRISRAARRLAVALRTSARKMLISSSAGNGDTGR